MAKQSRSDREAVKAKLEQERQRQAAVERRRKVLMYGVAAVVILAIVGAVGFGIAQETKDSGSSSGPTPVAATADDGGIPNGPTAEQASAKGLPTVDVYEDFQCPACKSFEAESGPTLEKLAADGKARVIYHPINLIGAKFSGVAGSSSLRAGSAFACTTDTPDFMRWHDVAFRNQPEEGTGITDEQLVQWGAQAGVTSDAYKKCVQDQTYVGWVKRVDAQSGDRGVTGTPTVYVAGKELKRSPNQYTPAGITAAVAAATNAK